MNKEQERFEYLMSRYFPNFSLKKDKDGDYKNTHILVAKVLYEWGLVDSKPVLLSTTETRQVRSPDIQFSGWEIETPPDDWFKKELKDK